MLYTNVFSSHYNKIIKTNIYIYFKQLNKTGKLII